jgi:hypothetical protein
MRGLARRPPTSPQLEGASTATDGSGTARSPVEHHVRDPEHTPWLGRLLGYGAMLPLVVAAAGVWFLEPEPGALVLHLAVVWGASLLAFFAGVRRGVSFRTEGGPTRAQLAGMIWLFTLAVAALVIPASVPALVVIFAGFASLITLDAKAARTGEAPRYFRRLRPPQMTVALVAVVVLLTWTWAHQR